MLLRKRNNDKDVYIDRVDVLDIINVSIKGNDEPLIPGDLVSLVVTAKTSSEFFFSNASFISPESGMEVYLFSEFSGVEVNDDGTITQFNQLMVPEFIGDGIYTITSLIIENHEGVEKIITPNDIQQLKDIKFKVNKGDVVLYEVALTGNDKPLTSGDDLTLNVTTSERVEFDFARFKHSEKSLTFDVYPFDQDETFNSVGLITLNIKFKIPKGIKTSEYKLDYLGYKDKFNGIIYEFREGWEYVSFKVFNEKMR